MIEISVQAALYYICIKKNNCCFNDKPKEVINMKKSSFVALVLGTVSGVLFSLGMCMALVEEWAMLKDGVIMGTAGLLLGVGLCLCLVLEKYLLGTVIGLVGIVMLLGLIPMVKGLK